MRLVVTGSLAYDYLMTFPGRFRDHLLQDRMNRMTVSFLVDDMRKLRGGVAGNITYSLALLGERPLLVATAGDDFEEYRGALEAAGVDTSGVRVVSGTFTASCFINTDQDANQLVAFYAALWPIPSSPPSTRSGSDPRIWWSSARRTRRRWRPAWPVV